MFSKSIIDSDAFLDMPLSTQALYFHLCMRADDDGFVNNPKRIMRTIGASDDDAKVLLAKKFIIPFESGVVVIKHWRIHNYIRKDTYHETNYRDEKSMLDVKENKAYSLKDEGFQDTVDELLTSRGRVVDADKNSIDKNRLDKNSIDTMPSCQDIADMFNEICVSLPRVMVLSDTRKANIRKRLKERSVDEIRLAFQKAEESDFLSGRNGKWQACNFDWFFRNEGNIVKVLEGTYSRNDTAKGKTMNDLRDIGMTQEEYMEMERRFK